MELKKRYVILQLDATENTCGSCKFKHSSIADTVMCTAFGDSPRGIHRTDLVKSGDDYARCTECLSSDMTLNLKKIAAEAEDTEFKAGLTRQRIAHENMVGHAARHARSTNTIEPQVDYYALFRYSSMRYWLRDPNAETFVKNKGWTLQRDLKVGDTIIFGEIAFIGNASACEEYRNEQDRSYAGG